MDLRMTADQWARSGTSAFTAGSFRGCFDKPRVTGVAEIVVGTAIDEAAAIEADCACLPSASQPPRSQQVGGAKGVEFLFDPAEARR